MRYNTTHFREKNMDVMPAEVLQVSSNGGVGLAFGRQLLLGSSKPFVKEVLQGAGAIKLK